MEDSGKEDHQESSPVSEPAGKSISQNRGSGNYAIGKQWFRAKKRERSQLRKEEDGETRKGEVREE